MWETSGDGVFWLEEALLWIIIILTGMFNDGFVSYKHADFKY